MHGANSFNLSYSLILSLYFSKLEQSGYRFSAVTALVGFNISATLWEMVYVSCIKRNYLQGRPAYIRGRVLARENSLTRAVAGFGLWTREKINELGLRFISTALSVEMARMLANWVLVLVLDNRNQSSCLYSYVVYSLMINFTRYALDVSKPFLPRR